MNRKHRLICAAIILMEHSEPLPLHLYAALVEEFGVDVNELDRLHRP